MKHDHNLIVAALSVRGLLSMKKQKKTEPEVLRSDFAGEVKSRNRHHKEEEKKRLRKRRFAHRIPRVCNENQ